jgi:hypothetical protein
VESQSKKYTVIVSKRAAGMLVSHASFLAQASETAALRLTDSFVIAANSLETMPQRCPFLNNDYIPKNKYRKLIFEEKYLIIFQIVDDKVYVDHIVDCRQDYGWLVK